MTEGARSPLGAALRRFAANRRAAASVAVLVLIGLICFAGPRGYSYAGDDADFDAISLPVELLSRHPFGTDDLGRDLLLRTMEGGQVSLLLGFLGALVSVIISVAYGATAGYLGALTDSLMMRLVDIMLSVPFMFLVILINVMLGESNASLFISVVLTLWLTPSIIARGQAVSLRNREFVEAARAGGATRARVILRHIIPNSINVVIVYSSLLVVEAVLTESFLSFLGLGVQPPAASWGTLISDGALRIETDARLLLLPGGFLAATLICMNFIADGLRDAFDPHE